MSFTISKYHFKSDHIFDGISQKTEVDLKKIKTVALFSKGEILYEENTNPKAVYFLKKGKVKIEQLNPDGKVRIFYIYTDGEYFGFRPLLSNEMNPVSASFLEDSELEIYEGTGFKSIVRKSSQLSFNLIEILSYEFNVWINLMSSLSHKSAKEKIALILLILDEKYKTSEGISEITMTKSDIARYTETTEETVVRVLSFFAEQGIIRNEGRVFEVIDVQMLEIIAERF
ncbi:Crp/Fnr family transcriptional regulator [Flavobacterium noncentrifugens]|uniref:CRP/FNR family transcriptional regulator, anaerobic regulatory protein n=1 Tax=Flavobacterium noncentrifugens TaxID=1128970 RepID=A0A1G8WRR5_9FLAO|nr:Crp/Fnr family transcriptional regulator [Flavobacterium noncentrifugens]GEP51032.1 Crp/Fnr family transcriptional regulator [Flavobacterium noncentrifugens]SDJ80964.1 CRP/FNR family transcriptional regulator, anaerobic regulatory protein [Flavobacterium noncentrifugens]